MDSAVNNAENQNITEERTPEEVPPESSDKKVEENGDNNRDTDGSTAEILTNVEDSVQEVEDNIKIDKDDDIVDDTKEDKKDDIVEDSDIKEEEKEPEETPDQATAVGLADEGKKDEMTSESDETKTEAEPKVEVKDEWLDILGTGLLKKKVIRAGKEGSSRPATGQEVCVKTEGTLENGHKVDVFEEKSFILGDGDVITGWDLCVATMLEGEVCELMTVPRFAYGSIGREDELSDIPPDSQITYILELLSIKPGPTISDLTDEQRIEIGDKKRVRGNELFKREDYQQAVYSYSRALKYLEPSTSEEVMKLKVKCWNNIGASHLKLGEYVAARNACDSVLQVEPDNVKALFRKGKVLIAKGEFEEALELLRKANSLDPESRLIRKELSTAKQKYDEERKKERSMYQRMVNGLGDTSKTENKNSFFTWPVILGITGVALGGIVAALLLTRHQL